MKRLLLAMALTLGPLSASATDLLDLYQQAKQTDPQIRAALATRNATYENEPIARSGLLPQITAGGDLSYQRQHILSSPTVPGGSLSDSYASNSLSLNLVQPLYHRDRWVALSQAEEQIKQANATYEQAKQSLMMRLTTAYFGVLSAKDSLKFAQAQEKAILRQRDQAKERYDVGLVAITDVKEAQAGYDQARANVIAAANAVDTAVEALREIVPDAPRAIDGLKKEVPLLAASPASIDHWSKLAQHDNPGIVAAGLGADIAQKNISLKQSGHYPTLDLVGSLTRARANSSLGTDVNSGAVGLQLSMPLYTGGGVSAETRKAAAQYQAALDTLDQQRRSVARQVRDAYRGIESSISQVQALKATEISAQSALQATEAGFDAGTRTLVDVLNSQSALYKAMSDHAQARYNYVLNKLGLLQAAGTLNKQDLQMVNGWLKRGSK